MESYFCRLTVYNIAGAHDACNNYFVMQGTLIFKIYIMCLRKTFFFSENFLRAIYYYIYIYSRPLFVCLLIRYIFQVILLRISLIYKTLMLGIAVLLTIQAILLI